MKLDNCWNMLKHLKQHPTIKKSEPAAPTKAVWQIITSFDVICFLNQSCLWKGSEWLQLAGAHAMLNCT